MPTSSTKHTSAAERDAFDAFWKRDLSTVNRRMFPLFVYLSLLVLVMYSIVDYFTARDHWSQLAWLRITLFVVGIVVMVLFKKGKLNLTRSVDIYVVAIYLFLAYGASLLSREEAFLTWNLTTALTVLVWPTLLVAVSFRRVMYLNYALLLAYMVFFELSNTMSYRDLAVYGGIFMFIALVVSPYLVKVRIDAMKRNARLRFDMRKVNENLRKANEQLAELNASKDKFFSIISHDLRSPFNSLINLSMLLKDDGENMECSETREYADIIHRTSLKTYNLLQNLLDWSRSATGAILYEPESMHLLNVIADMVESLESSASTKQVRLDVDVKSEDIVKADRNMIATVLRNLVGNAIKFTPEGGTVTIEIADSEPGWVAVSVRDTGVGIATDRIPDMFDISKVKSTPGTNDEKGSGLGLILCKEFVDYHGGRIWVDSTEGEGSVFTFTLPVG